MPYITKIKRQQFNKHIEALAKYADHPGEINYIFSMLVRRILDRFKRDYMHINIMVGVFECAKLELYRRIAAPYEDKKIQENGDIYN